MTKSLLALPLLVTACMDTTYPEQRPTPTTPIDATPTATIEDNVIATGGVQRFETDKSAIGLEGFASDGYTVEPPRGIWPNLNAPVYDVRALESGTGTFEIITSRGIATGIVESADIASIRAVPTDYQLDGSSPFALDLSRREITIELRDAAGRRLVDASLGIPVQQTAWDRATLPAKAVRHIVALYADSFGEHALAIDVVDQIERMESRVDGARTCFHAYAGTTEVAVAMTITGGDLVPGAANCAIGTPATLIARVNR
jgi:hypothetical protein